jgi:thiaminase/transcriptional activator TenA
MTPERIDDAGRDPAGGSFCESLRDGCGGLWGRLHEHPFLHELADGTLAPERFRFYLEQDLFFLPELARAVALGVAAAEDEVDLRHFAEEMVAVAEREIAGNRELLARTLELGAGDRGGASAPAPATLAYAGFLVATAARGGPLEIMTALLPCTWSYADVAAGLSARTVPHPVYGRWVDYFASSEYAELIAARRRTLDERAAAAGPERRRRLSEIFTMSTRLELAFWEMAYACEQWPDLREVA